MGFQILMSGLIVFAICALFTQFYKKHISLPIFSAFLFTWSLVLILNWNNNLLNRFGHLLGIERGATILVYFALFLLFYHMFFSMMKFYKMEKDLNEIVRKEAINDFMKRHNINSE